MNGKMTAEQKAHLKRLVDACCDAHYAYNEGDGTLAEIQSTWWALTEYVEALLREYAQRTG